MTSRTRKLVLSIREFLVNNQIEKRKEALKERAKQIKKLRMSRRRFR